MDKEAKTAFQWFITAAVVGAVAFNLISANFVVPCVPYDSWSCSEFVRAMFPFTTSEIVTSADILSATLVLYEWEGKEFVPKPEPKPGMLDFFKKTLGKLVIKV